MNHLDNSITTDYQVISTSEHADLPVSAVSPVPTASTPIPPPTATADPVSLALVLVVLVGLLKK